VLLALRAELRSRNWFSESSGRSEPKLANLLDLVALGTVADVVSLDHNNRVLVSQGPAAHPAGPFDAWSARPSSALRDAIPRKPRASTSGS
jgi:single-stranded DNA-specific DHH superfamily exonuclease